MGEVNFYLKKPPPKTKTNKNPKSLIYLQFKYNGRRLVFSFGQNIDPAMWNLNKQRVKSKNETTKDGTYSLNDLLDKLEEILLSAYRKELVNGIPSTEKLKMYLINFMNQNEPDEDKPTLYKLIERFISGEIKNKGKNKASGTLAKYKTAYNYLKAFELKTRYKIDFDTINKDFFTKYVSFLGQHRFERNNDGSLKPVVSETGLAQNTIAKQIDHIKTFMNEAIELEYTDNVRHKKKSFSVETVESESVCLTEKESMKLYKHDFSDNKKLDQVRDLFLFGANVGQRYSDYSTVKPENIITIDGEKFIKIKAQKTGQRVVIPCNPIVLQIFEKYKHNHNSLPKPISLQKFNLYLKIACKEAGLIETGRLQSMPDKPLYELISSHSARRQFATSLYHERFPIVEIMKITGHKTESELLNKYLKISEEDAAKKLSLHNKKKNWSELLLKAV